MRPSNSISKRLDATLQFWVGIVHLFDACELAK